MGDHDPSDDEAASFDLGHWLKSYQPAVGACAWMDVSWFTDAKKLDSLHRQVSERKGSFVAHVGFEEWAPQWLGLDASSSARRALFNKRAKNMESSSSVDFISNILTFWLSHSAAGAVSLLSVFAHIMVILKMCHDHSSKFAIRYERRLVIRVQELLRIDSSVNIDSKISFLDPGIVTTLELEDARQWSGPRAPHSQPLPTARTTRKDETKPRDDSKKRPLKDSVRLDNSVKKKYVCFDHDPASKATCSKTKCTFEHLDTTKPDLRARWLQAKAAAERNPKKSLSGKP